MYITWAADAAEHSKCWLQGNTYRPTVVRIGSEEAPVSERAKHVWVDGLIKAYMEMDGNTWDHRQASLRCLAANHKLPCFNTHDNTTS